MAMVGYMDAHPGIGNAGSRGICIAAASPYRAPTNTMGDMMKFLPILLAPLALLTACDSGPKVEADNAKPSEVAAKARAAGMGTTFVRPGMWASTVTILEMNIPGMPPEFAAKMKQQMAQARGYESCLTPEQAKKPKEDFFAGVDKSCRYDHFEMDGGKIDAAMRCTRDKMVQTMTMSGSYSPDRYDMSMTTKMEGGGPQAGTTMKMRVEAKRVGECDAKATAEANRMVEAMNAANN